MTTTRTSKTQASGDRWGCTAFDRFTGPGVMDWTCFAAGLIMAGVGGTATNFTAIVERSFVDPNDPTAGAWQIAFPAGPDVMTGAAGNVAPNVYRETGTGWWRIRVTDVQNGYVTAMLNGPLP